MKIIENKTNLHEPHSQHKLKSGLPKLFFTIKETAYVLSVSEKTVRRLLERGLLKSSYALRTKLITHDSIEAFSKLTT